MKKKHMSVKVSIIKSALLGVCLSCIIAIGAICIITSMIQRERLAMSQLRYVVPCIHFLSLLVGGLLTNAISKENRLYSDGVVFVLQYLAYIALVVLAFDGQFSGIVISMVSGLLGILSSVVICTAHKGRGIKRINRKKFC